MMDIGYWQVTSLQDRKAGARVKPNGETACSAADSGHKCVSNMLKGQSERKTNSQNLSLHSGSRISAVSLQHGWVSWPLYLGTILKVLWLQMSEFIRIWDLKHLCYRFSVIRFKKEQCGRLYLFKNFIWIWYPFIFSRNIWELDKKFCFSFH